MSAYAILGATGQVGGSVLKLLGNNTKNKINVLVRSRSKLEKSYPPLSSNKNISVFEGSISNNATLASCLKNTRAVFLCVAVSENVPNVSIALDTAKSVVGALQSLKKESSSSSFKPPRLVVLSASTIDPTFWRDYPAFFRNVMYAASGHIYNDLALAESFLRQHEDWLDMTFMMPGGLTHDVQQGHVLSTEKQEPMISFLDLAGAMVEVADSGGEWDKKHVSILLKEGRKARYEWGLPLVLGKGLLFYYFPWLYGWLP